MGLNSEACSLLVYLDQALSLVVTGYASGVLGKKLTWHGVCARGHALELLDDGSVGRRCDC